MLQTFDSAHDNQIAGRNGVLLKNVLENRMNGTKGRGVYESPGLDLLSTAARHLFQATVDKDGWELMRFLSPFIARQTYAGRLYDPATQTAINSVEELTANASGVVDMICFKGSYTVDRVHDYAKSRFTAQQFRFAHGGQDGRRAPHSPRSHCRSGPERLWSAEPTLAPSVKWLWARR